MLTALSLAACASSGTANNHQYEQFRVSCCATADLDTAWHPGEDVTLHWVIQSAGTTTDAAGPFMNLEATLSGPFESVAGLKARSSGPDTLTAAPFHMSDRYPGDPVSVIALPSNLASGWYNLVWRIESGGGNSLGGASVIRVSGA